MCQTIENARSQSTTTKYAFGDEFAEAVALVQGEMHQTRLIVDFVVGALTGGESITLRIVPAKNYDGIYAIIYKHDHTPIGITHFGCGRRMAYKAILKELIEFPHIPHGVVGNEFFAVTPF
jgi:hypothetical protein